MGGWVFFFDLRTSYASVVSSDCSERDAVDSAFGSTIVEYESPVEE